MKCNNNAQFGNSSPHTHVLTILKCTGNLIVPLFSAGRYSSGGFQMGITWTNLKENVPSLPGAAVSEESELRH